MLRTSSYTIYVDLPDNRAEMLLVHGYTGAYDKVSRRLADYLRTREARRPPKPLYGEWSPEPEVTAGVEPVPEAAIATLNERGYLTELDPEAEETFFTRLVARLHERAAQRTPSYIFMPTYDCNLRCSYCFQDHMRTDSAFRHLLTAMRPEMVERIFRALPAIEQRHGVDAGAARRRSVGFFGGEPLLAANRPIVEHVMDQARRLGEADFWAVTNATEIDAYRDVLGPQGIGRLQITLDGPPREHDRRRVYADGGGSFERIAKNVTMALAEGCRVSIRLNLDHGNIGDLPALAEEMVARGWPELSGFSAYSAPIHAGNEKTDRATTMNSWELDQALTALREKHPVTAVVGRPDEAIRGRAREIFAGEKEILPQMRPSFCGAHEQMYIFDPFGNVYACWEKTGDARIRVAHVTPESDVVFQHEVHQEWRSRSVASNPVCRRCRYALHCGGGCAVLALGQRGKFHANYCDGFASRFRAGVAEAFQAHVRGEAAGRIQERLCDL